MTVAKKDDAKALTTDQRLDAVIALPERNGMSIPKELKPAKQS